MDPKEGQIVYRQNITKDLAIFRISNRDGSQIEEFIPGQFINLGLRLGEEIIQRPYSIASSPKEKNYYEFYIKQKEFPTLGKFTSELFKRVENDFILLQKPIGNFTIEGQSNDTYDKRQMILVSSGTGLAPFMSYIRYLKSTGTKRNIVLLHGVSFLQELGYGEILQGLSDEKNESWNFTYIPTVSRPSGNLSQNWNGHVGRVEGLISGIEKHTSKIEQILGQSIMPQNSMFYICGYKGMIDYVVSMLSPLGFVDSHNKRKDCMFDIKYELFGV